MPSSSVCPLPMAAKTNIELQHDFEEWGVESRPPGGFVNLINAPSNHMHHVAEGSPSQPINVENGDISRTKKRLLWTNDEDLRLISAWLNNSNDSIESNFKKNDKYWGDVAAAYNSTTPKSREANSLYASGESHDDLMAKAHAFFGVAGSNNDINVPNQSPLFLEQVRGEAPRVHFSVNGNEYNNGYYLADGIYPYWASFIKSISLPQTEKHKLFAKRQEGARKDVERAFGVLQARFNIVRRPAKKWKRKSVGKIMLACVILHNMIVEDEREDAICDIDLNRIPRTSIVLPPEVTSVLTVPYPAPPPDPRNPYSRIILMLLDTDVGKDEGIVEELDVVIAGQDLLTGEEEFD
ncbi:ribosomal protein-like [Oryza sativa Japonica Group]|uniref:Ribosomal protein-like n=1 Tax=Oryza sativa subsp. japonica TaxID=39947 RepID=Q5NBB0_ORYSJ|nr:ribosomal protein-like [Oryza sativa Japonica Group]